MCARAPTGGPDEVCTGDSRLCVVTGAAVNSLDFTLNMCREVWHASSTCRKEVLLRMRPLEVGRLVK